MAVTPSLGEISHRPDTLVELTGRAATCPIALQCPRGLQDSTATAQSSNSHCALMVKYADRTCRFLDRMRRCAYHPHAQRYDRTRSTQRLNTIVLASGHDPKNSLSDRMHSITCDRTRHASDQLFVTHYTKGCLTGHAGSARDRMCQWQTLVPHAAHTWSTDRTRRSRRDHVRSSVRSHQ
jgi:hypothetical protein